MTLISWRARPKNDPKPGPEGAIMIESWLDCFGGDEGSKLRVNGKIVGEVGFKGLFHITCQRKWVANILAGWLELPVKRNHWNGYTSWSISWHEPEPEPEPVVIGWEDDPLALKRQVQ